jgi:hypothetical protein
MNGDLQAQINMLRQQIEALSAEFHTNNFNSSQDFNKYSRFNTRLKVPKHDTPPTTCEVGEIIEDGGVLKICSAANTWTTVGTQT